MNDENHLNRAQEEDEDDSQREMLPNYNKEDRI